MVVNQNNPNIVRARTVLHSNSYRINWRNVGYLELTKKDKKYTATIYWKYKAGIMKEPLEIGGEDFDPHKFFKQYSIVALTDTKYINLSNIMLIKEDYIYGKIDNVKVVIILTDGFKVEAKIEAKKWSWWRETYA